MFGSFAERIIDLDADATADTIVDAVLAIAYDRGGTIILHTTQ